MIKEFKLPDLGEGLTESEIVSWHVAVGDTVVLNQVIAEVETAKAVVELPSPYDGVIARLHEEPGTVVQVGETIVSFDVVDDSAVVERSRNPEPGPNPEVKRVPTLVGYGADPEKTGRPVRRRRIGAPAPAVVERSAAEPKPGSAATGPAAPSPQVETTVAAPGAAVERPRSTPPVRKLARDLGIDLTTVAGSGAGGLIVREDVLAAKAGAAPVSAAVPAAAEAATAAPGPAAAAQVPAPPSSSFAGRPREERADIKGVRKHTAAAMVASAFTAPHVTEFLTVDVTASMELLERLRARRDFAGLKLTPLTLVAKALCLAAARQPSVNSRWDEANGQIITMNYVNLGIAAATPRGLLVPNIKDAHALDLRQLAAALGELAETARAGKTTPAALGGGTISITNIGVFGIDAGTPILNPGEAAIVAMGAVRRQPWEHNGEVALRQVMTLSLSFDHRLVDGEQGSRFLADIGAVLADPALVLAMV
ncbi:dihydrolipoamide acetyltransferase family protein [Arthrobacter sp. 35W]|uniref:dihydrolipoamide acetyltransferase family protein n=1 Tax=Arthrobacter sp. 35W TaxID=1132441 RepID=UPI00047C18FC|nr:dihydrolipoamide acetyltransferase family protein [Arthrobacter sp. 35W]